MNAELLTWTPAILRQFLDGPLLCALPFLLLRRLGRLPVPPGPLIREGLRILLWETRLPVLQCLRLPLLGDLPFILGLLKDLALL